MAGPRPIIPLWFWLLAAMLTAPPCPASAKGPRAQTPRVVVKALHQARDCMARSRHQEAVDILAPLRRPQGPGLPPAGCLMLGNALHALGRIPEAGRAWAMGLEGMDDGSGGSRDHALHAALAANQALAEYRQGHPGRAAALFLAAFDHSDPPDPELLMRASAARLESGDAKTALVLAKRLDRISPKPPLVWLELMARCAVHAGDRAWALNRLAKLASRHPDRAEWWRMSAGLRLEDGDCPGAAADLEMALAARQKPGRHLGRDAETKQDARLLADMYFHMGAHLSGARCLKLAAGDDPGPGDCDRLWRALARAGRLDQALKWLDKAQHMAPNVQRLTDKALLLEDAARLDQAATAWRAALDLDPDDPQALMGQACLAWSRGNMQLARRALEKAACGPARARAKKALKALIDLNKTREKRPTEPGS